VKLNFLESQSHVSLVVTLSLVHLHESSGASHLGWSWATWT